ncbi:hypothetical protein NL108_018549 [Boleophthalmus pectinirostris]|nr:hypothetical protein NL108_018549 [Boleophthalmus pectinirostris]
MFLEAVLEEAPKSPLMSLRIALIGKSETVQTVTAKTILGKKSFQRKTARTQTNTTSEKVMVSRTVQGRTITMTITPPLFDNSFSEEEFSNCISQSCLQDLTPSYCCCRSGK